jgi:glycosyltransferase involved in cell wall biosynthesis
MTLLAKAGYLRRHFSHAWVAGAMQFEYARRLGFDKAEIVFDLYSADLNLFDTAYTDAKNVNGAKAGRYPHRFLFIGRLEEVKSVDVLAQAWQSLAGGRRDWELALVGHGSLKESLAGIEGVVLKDFMQPPQLRAELAAAGCFVLPSRAEPWGVVLHESAAAGLPLLCSNVCGAASAFLIRGHNGFAFKANDQYSLREAMQRVIALDDDALRAMGEASHRLAQRITPGSSAANLLSIQTGLAT